MDYNLETLGPDSFQKLCQSILIAAHPQIACLPVNQPDGGRDAFVFSERVPTNGRAKRSFVAFQVKFSTDPSSVTEREAIISLVKSEKYKVEELKKRGLSAYYFLTNIRGTAHLDVGSIDRVNAELTADFGVPSYCYWRDDIERRLDLNQDLKWNFPSILRGTDLLKTLLTGDLGEASQRRAAALKAYITSQYSLDEDVKFKQVELQNRLLDLFIDVPVRLLNSGTGSDWTHETFRRAKDADEEILIRSLVATRRDHGLETIDASAVFLRQRHVGLLSRVVIEGAPGQGKSTITQYLCQVHRIRILNRSYELTRLPSAHALSQMRLPFRVDLRDYATWVSGRSPFGATPNNSLPPGTSTALESFLSAQVADSSGGFKFEVADLSQVIKDSHVLIVLDGFDEVADVPTRKILVEQINQASHRLEDQSKSLQMVVTSRPSAFANSPGFPERHWLHLDLLSLTQRQINDYASKWMRARGLPEKQKIEFRSVLKNRLDQPHIRDLARNPMQLAILLSLINTKGLSLPDKRTALYESYVDLFFSREAEKSDIVRDHRDLLIALHRFLAWVLQSEAETGSGTGSIEDRRLRTVLREFLDHQGHDSTLVDTLFTGMVDRVVALVSRVQGTYEFEVQPLREYFCARYLYETAPFSPAWREQTGTKPDRFAAISCNFYWFNVARFYAGCYSTGELASLVDGIEQLAGKDGFSHISQPRHLATTLLADWVFMQQPHTARRVTDFILQEPGLKLYLASSVGPRSQRSLSIPEPCGRKPLVERAISLLKSCAQSDYQQGIAKLLSSNLTDKEAYQLWLQLEHSSLAPCDRIGLITSLEIADLVEVSEWKKIASHERSRALQQLLENERIDVLYQDSELRDQVIGGLVSGELQQKFMVKVGEHENKMGVIETAIAAFSRSIFVPSIQRGYFSGYGHLPLRELLSRYVFGSEPVSKDYSKLPVSDNITEFAHVFDKVLNETLDTWRTKLEPWLTLVEEGRRLLGEGTAWRKLAVLSAGIRSKSELGHGGEDTFDETTPLVQRARHARLRTGVASFWKNILSKAKSDDDVHFAVLLLVCWASPKVIAEISDYLSILVDGMDQNRWAALAGCASDIFSRPFFSDSSLDKRSYEGPSRSPRLLYLLSLRSHPMRQISIYHAGLYSYTGEDAFILQEKADAALGAALYDETEWSKSLDAISSSYSRLGSIDSFEIRRMKQDRTPMPIAIAERICTQPIKYPLTLLAVADSALTEHAGRSSTRVGEIARRANWFRQN